MYMCVPAYVYIHTRHNQSSNQMRLSIETSCVDKAMETKLRAESNRNT